MNVKLIKLTKEYYSQLSEMIDEWRSDQEMNHTNHSPWAIFKNDYHDFNYYLDHLEIKEPKEAVPYSQQDELYKNSLQPCRTQFGADFSKLKNPMLYYPDGDITLSGVIPSLNNAKFQYRFLEPSGNGCFLWLDSIQLTDDTINRISKIYGVYKNWRQQLYTTEDNKPLKLKNEG